MSVGNKASRAVFAILVLAASGARAQEANEIVRCRALTDDARRLACYDAIPAARASPLSKFELVPFEELQDFALSYRGRLVETTGFLRPGASYFSLGRDEEDARPVPVDPEGLGRRERETLLERCGDGCEATVQGRVRPLNFTTGIVADAVIVR